MKADKCVLNKSNVYMDLYKDILLLTFKLDENANLSGFEDLEEYHYDWLFKNITYESVMMQHFKRWVYMNKDEKVARPELIEKVKLQANSKDKDEIKEYIYTLSEYKLQEAIDVTKTCETLINNN